MSLTGSGALTHEELRTFSTDGDHDIFSHYVTKEDALIAAVEGTPVMALCGKVWVPHRDPDSYPVCATCSEMMELI